ncbi:hypothetical protein Pmani_005891 [Petrolisthes manimaculis]|uniref:Uncharacterized protein n=1 Tax=Petrolisthes manimaculis TaxID=1843537 RepID=A0AAE1QE11_9EUCA|nr:hypothetical protein Pmani_005891 [Petrolisthes manimaculis]
MIAVLTPQLYIEVWVHLPVHFPVSCTSSSNTMSLLDYIDKDFANRDPELAAAILEFEGIQVLTLSYPHLQLKKKGRKAHFHRQKGHKSLLPLLQELARGVLLIFIHGGAGGG